MKHAFTKSLVALLFGVLTLASCSKDDESASATLNLQFSVNNNPVSTANARLANAETLTFQGGKVTIREVVFDADLADGSNSISITHEQIAEIDLATGTVTPEVAIQLPANRYESVYLGIEIQDENDIPSVVVNGTFHDSSNESVPVRFEFNSGEVFEAEAATISLTEEQDVVGRITFAPHHWFSTISTEQLEAASRVDGVIVISETVNANLFSIVADRLDDATEAVFQ